MSDFLLFLIILKRKKNNTKIIKKITGDILYLMEHKIEHKKIGQDLYSNFKIKGLFLKNY